MTASLPVLGRRHGEAEGVRGRRRSRRPRRRESGRGHRRERGVHGRRCHCRARERACGSRGRAQEIDTAARRHAPAFDGDDDGRPAVRDSGRFRVGRGTPRRTRRRRERKSDSVTAARCFAITREPVAAPARAARFDDDVVAPSWRPVPCAGRGQAGMSDVASRDLVTDEERRLATWTGRQADDGLHACTTRRPGGSGASAVKVRVGEDSASSASSYDVSPIARRRGTGCVG